MAFFDLTRNNLGPLTTEFTPAPSCATPSYTELGGTTLFNWGRQCVNQKGTDEWETYAGPCYPSGLAAVHEGGNTQFHIPVYSPGLVCPAGFTSACSIVKTEDRNPFPATSDGSFSIWDILSASETAVGCCPRGYACADHIASHCTITYAADDVLPATINGKNCELTSTKATINPVRGIYEGYAIRVNLFNTNSIPKQTSGPTGVSTGGSNGFSPSGGTSANAEKSSSGFSSGALIAVAIAVPALLIIAAVIAFIFWRRRRNKTKAAKAAAAAAKASDAFNGSSSAFKAELEGTVGVASTGGGMESKKPELSGQAVTTATPWQNYPPPPGTPSGHPYTTHPYPNTPPHTYASPPPPHAYAYPPPRAHELSSPPPGTAYVSPTTPTNAATELPTPGTNHSHTFELDGMNAPLLNPQQQQRPYAPQSPSPVPWRPSPVQGGLPPPPPLPPPPQLNTNNSGAGAGAPSNQTLEQLRAEQARMDAQREEMQRRIRLLESGGQDQNGQNSQ